MGETFTYDDARAAVADGATPMDAARRLVAGLTPDERLWCLDGDLPAFTGLAFMTEEDGYRRAPFIAGRTERVGLPGLAFADGPRGCVLGNATCFPVSMARGATWDPDLEERVGEAIGAELAASGANLTGAVCMNVLRHPAWGRAQETYGEDPHHVGELAAALTRGLQRHVMACAKHYAANSMENARFTVDIEVDDVALHEVYLPHFRRVVDAGVASIMSAYNQVNGSWCGEHRELLTEILRGEWGFEGFVISDWIFGIRDAARSLAGGLDVEMPARMVRYEYLRAALDAGEASWDDVDTAVARVVATMLRFDDVLGRASDPAVVGSASHRALAREVAAGSVVLLRNEVVDEGPVLPVDPSARIAVLGPLADVVNVGDAGSSDVWDLHCATVADGIRAAFSEVVVDDGSDVDRAAAAAAQADVALLVVGYTRHDEGEFLGDLSSLPLQVMPSSEEPDVVERLVAWKEHVPPIERPDRVGAGGRSFDTVGGDRSSLRLKPADVDLIRAVAAANPRTVVAIQAGSAVIVSEWVDDVPAVVQSWYGGAEAGPGLADVLTGVVNPSGRLPFTVPTDEADLPSFDRDATRFTYDRWHGWWHLQRHGTTPAYPFGFGLSYTTFALGSIEASRAEGVVTVTGSLHNTGAGDGADVVQVYATLPDPDAPPRLVGFVRAEVPAGDERTFEIRVPFDRLALRRPTDRSWEIRPGRYDLHVARFVGDPDGATVTVEI